MMPSPILSAIHQFSTQWSNLFVNMTHSLHLFFHILKGILIPNELSFDFVLNQEFFSIFSANLIFTNRFSSSFFGVLFKLLSHFYVCFVYFDLLHCVVSRPYTWRDPSWGSVSRVRPTSDLQVSRPCKLLYTCFWQQTMFFSFCYNLFNPCPSLPLSLLSLVTLATITIHIRV